MADHLKLTANLTHELCWQTHVTQRGGDVISLL
jgi:hypothetical protein